jgi:hypothetical protein
VKLLCLFWKDEKREYMESISAVLSYVEESLFETDLALIEGCN